MKYESETKIYGFKSTCDPYQVGTDGLIIFESFIRNPSYDSLQDGLGDYRVTIETEVEDKSQLCETYERVSELAQSLDRVWMYTCGHPLSKKHFSFLAPYIQPLDGTLPGWSNNFKDVEKEFDRGKRRIEFSFHHLHWAVYNTLPLSNALNIKKAFSKASESIKTLVDLHYFSHKAKDGYSMCFFLAKGLELVRALLPGKTKEEKEKNLAADILKNLYSSFNNVFDLSNNRFEARHIVRDPKNLILHPKMNNEEIRIFKHDADLIIRSVVCEHLDAELLIPSSEQYK